MFNIPQARYRKIALECLAEHGITPSAMALEASPALKRFRLDVDMGLIDVEAPEVVQGEDPLLPYATSFLTHLIAWPPKVEAYGVSIAGLIEEAVCWMVGFNETEVEKPDWKTRIGRSTPMAEEGRIIGSRHLASRFIEQLLRDLPAEHYSYRVCEMALLTVADSLQHMPVSVRTREVCMKAVSVLTTNAEHVPHEIMDEEMLNHMIEKAPFSIMMIPRQLYTQALVEKAVAGNRSVVVLIPDEYLTPKLLEAKFKEKEESVARARQRKCVDN